jgi:signal transduction histidine kinase
MIIRDTTQRLREVSEFTDATAASSIIREELFRTRLAAELHDEVGQRLSALLIESRRLENFLGQGRFEPVREAASSIREQLSECNRTVRDLVYETSPPTISQFGLPAALRDLVERMQSQTSMTIDYSVDTAQSDVELSFEGLPRTIEITCFRIIQEALTNVIKHAGAEHCTVTLTLGESTLSATIEDDGDGFHANERAGGFGLTGMRERSSAAGGTIRITGNPGEGTVVHVVLPLLRSEADRTDDLI